MAVLPVVFPALKRGLGRGAIRAATRLERRVSRHVLQDTSRRGRARALAHRDTRKVFGADTKAEGRGLDAELSELANASDPKRADG